MPATDAPTYADSIEVIAKRLSLVHAIAGRELLDLAPLIRDVEVRADERRIVIEEQEATIDRLGRDYRARRTDAVSVALLLEGLRCDGYSPHHAECIATRDQLCTLAGDELPEHLRRFVQSPVAASAGQEG